MTPDDPRHGTTNGYNNLRCRCDRCREAWRASTSARRSILRIALLLVRCPMCHIGIFPGHGHQKWNGTVTRIARLTWV